MKKSKIVQMYWGRRQFTASAVAVAFLSLLPTWESGAVYGSLPAKRVSLLPVTRALSKGKIYLFPVFMKTIPRAYSRRKKSR